MKFEKVYGEAVKVCHNQTVYDAIIQAYYKPLIGSCKAIVLLNDGSILITKLKNVRFLSC